MPTLTLPGWLANIPLPAVLWLAYAVPAYVLWPLVFRLRHGFSPVVERFPPRNMYGWVDAVLGVTLVGYSVWIVFWPVRSLGQVAHDVAGLAGVAIVVAGCGLRVWAVVALGRHWRIGQDDQDSRVELVRDGPYRIMRHPINSALVLVAIGQGLMTGLDARALLLLVISVGYWLVQGRAEDRRWRHAAARSRDDESARADEPTASP